MYLCCTKTAFISLVIHHVRLFGRDTKNKAEKTESRKNLVLINHKLHRPDTAEVLSGMWRGILPRGPPGSGTLMTFLAVNPTRRD